MPSRQPSRENLGTNNSRALRPEEVGALRAESERLLRLEQDLMEREKCFAEREEQWLKESIDLRAQLDVAQLGTRKNERIAELEAALESEQRERREHEARAAQLQEMLERLGKRLEQAEEQAKAVASDRDALSEALARAMAAPEELPPLMVQPGHAVVRHAPKAPTKPRRTWPRPSA